MDLSVGTWLLLVAVAVLIGFDKSFLPGAAIVGLGFLATAIPAKQASGTTLALLIVADWTAIWAYRQHVQWRTLLRLLPTVALGVLLGVGFLFVADDAITRRTIGAIILLFTGVSLYRLVRPTTISTGRGRSMLFGTAAGFTSMVANAGGPVTSLYFLAEGFSVVTFLGTTAWFYLIINLVKLPFSLGLGLLRPGSLEVVAVLVPVIIGTVLVGRRLAGRVDRRLFTTLVLALSLVAGVLLII